jgi:transposase InsO family protein
MLMAVVFLVVLRFASIPWPVLAPLFRLRWFRYLPQYKRSKGFRVRPFVPCGRGGTRKPAWVPRAVLRLKALLPDASYREIEKLFNRLFAAKRKMTVSKSYVAYTVRDHRHEIELLRRRLKHRVPRQLPKNRLWALDLTGKGDSAGDLHSILGIEDHGTRRLLSIKALENKNAWTLLGHLFLAIGRFGRPRAIRSDNESMFRSFVFRAMLRFAGIVQQFTVPGCPWQNGRIERLFGTLKAKLDRIEIDSREALKGLLADFAFWYNAVRPHQHLGGLTPQEAWRELDPFRTAPKAIYRFEAWDGLLQGFYVRH